MKIFFTDGGYDAVKKVLATEIKKLGGATIKGYKSVAVGCLAASAAEEVCGVVCEVSDDGLWTFDRHFSPAVFCKKSISGDIFGLFLNSSANGGKPEIAETDGKEATKCDLLFMLPGYFDKKRAVVDTEHIVGNKLNNDIKCVADEEFAGKYIKNNTRVTVGAVTLACCEIEKCVSDICTEQKCAEDKTMRFQPAVVNLMYHNESGCCVAEIYVPNAGVPVQRLLSNYCSNVLKVFCGGKYVLLKDYLENLGITLYGDKRSMVFLHEDVSDEKLLNILVNEEAPMGKIVGRHFCDIIANNLAQYDTARVYASETTMVEVVACPSPDILRRIESQAIEIFFVEMLLLQDAAVSKMNETVKAKMEIERNNPYTNKSKEVVSELINEMSYAANFADYSQFYFPTVRVSAEKVSYAFGISRIEDKFEQNKELLQQMMANNTEKIAEKENAIKNSLLFIISLFSGIGVIASFIGSIFGGVTESVAFYISLCIMAAGVAVYFTTEKIIKRSMQKKHKRRRNDK